jgi:histidine triad (HIT) family protein
VDGRDKPGNDRLIFAGYRTGMAYDPDNVFAKVLRGELPCHKIYEDDDTLAFLDIMPRSEGHALVITKEKATDLFDVSPQALEKLMAVVQKLSPQIKEAVGADGELKPHAGMMEDQAKLAATAEKIKSKLGTA